MAMNVKTSGRLLNLTAVSHTLGYTNTAASVISQINLKKSVFEYVLVTQWLCGTSNITSILHLVLWFAIKSHKIIFRFICGPLMLNIAHDNNLMSMPAFCVFRCRLEL